MTWPTMLLGVEAPAVKPTVIAPDGSQFRLTLSGTSARYGRGDSRFEQGVCVAGQVPDWLRAGGPLVAAAGRYMLDRRTRCPTRGGSTEGLMPYLIGTDEAGYGPNLGPLVIAATAWQVPDDLPPAEEFKSEVFRRLDVQEETFRAFCAEQGVEFLSLTAALRAKIAEGVQVYYAYDQHWTRLGHVIAADAVASYLASRAGD